MSMKQNLEWLEAAEENFYEACELGNISMAKAIIADTFDAGFPSEARTMNLLLRTASMANNGFIISPIQM